MHRSAALLLVSAIACAPLGPKPPPRPANMVPVNASESALWHATIQVLTDRGLPIKDLRRSYGWIETEPAPIDTTRSAAWADCADPLQNAIPRPDRVAVVIRVARDGSTRSKVHVAPTWSYQADADVRCKTAGIWEEDLRKEITAAAVATEAGVPGR